MLKEDARILTRVKEVRSSHTKVGLCQILLCVLVIPDDKAGDQLEFRLDDWFAKLRRVMVNPHIQGTIPAGDEEESPIYKVLLWRASDNPAEQEAHFKKKPIELGGVRLGRYTAYPMDDYEGSTGISINLTTPHRSEALSGKIDALAGSNVMIQVIPVQTELEV